MQTTMCNLRRLTPHPALRRGRSAGGTATYIAAVVALLAFDAHAQTGGDGQAVLIQPDTSLSGATAPDLARSLRLRKGSGGRLRRPVWTHAGLWTAAPRRLHGLAKVERPGHPTYDQTARAWFAAANGSLVRVMSDGKLIVLAHDVQGIDVDVRAARGVAVSREPDHSIVLHRFGGSRTATRKVLLRGARFFGPRLSPDGTQALVSESRAAGGHTWLVSLANGKATDLGQSNDATWLPDGRGILFARVTHDGHQITGADLYLLDLSAKGPPRRLTRTRGLAETDPAVSPDGAWVAFVDALTGDLHMARLPNLARSGGAR